MKDTVMMQAARRTRYPGPIAEAAKHPHALVEQGFASDEALAEILHRYPADLIDINLFDYDAEGQVSLRTGAKGDLTGDQLLAAIQAGRGPDLAAVCAASGREADHLLAGRQGALSLRCGRRGAVPPAGQEAHFRLSGG
jgi:hypothetical protein